MRTKLGHAASLARDGVPPVGAREARAFDATRTGLVDRRGRLCGLYPLPWPPHVDRAGIRDGPPAQPSLGVPGGAHLVYATVRLHHLLRDRMRSPASHPDVGPLVARERARAR